MIQFSEAFEIVKSSVIVLEDEKLSIYNAVGRVLAEDIHSDMNMPPFNKSAVDGYACRREDIENELTLLEIVPAGKVPTKTVEKNQCSKVMTGAPVPDGADVVFMVEHAEETSTGKVHCNKIPGKSNISLLGEDIKENDLVLTKGTLLKPPHIAVLASVGCFEPLVKRLPIVAIISTGDELVEPNEKPTVGQIRNSNATQLFAQVSQCGAVAKYIGIAKDNPESTNQIISTALEQSDIILLSGGVSMGDFDFVPQILAEKGIDLKFKTIQVQPGKPTVFGTRDQQFFFGLPGNPVSSFVQFELLVKPLIRALQGSAYEAEIIRLPMGTDYSRKRTERKSFIPVQITTEGTVVPVDYHGSAHIHSYVFAEAITHIEIGEKEIKKGQLVDVRLL
ncbi:MAG: molybdopterin molybdotransferase MoeA [Bacteroidales bacterium]|nr:molybdopterin molybdotransferase MoeA [Bacteroidales bacterium]